MRVLGGLLGLVLLTGCTGGSGGPAEVTAGPSAGDARCTALLERLPSSLLDLKRGDAPAAGAARWGDVVLRCGVPDPGPTTDACIRTDGVDWIFTEDDRGYRFTTFGRTPAVEVTVPGSVERTRAPGAMTGLADAVQDLRQTRNCD